MDVLLLTVAVVLAGIGVDILRFPRQPAATLREEDELVFGKGASLPYARRRFYIWLGIHGSGIRTNEVRALAVILLVVSIAIAAKGLGIV